MKLVIEFRDTTGQTSPYTVKFKIKDTVLAQHWTRLFTHNFFENSHPIEKTYCLQRWQSTWETNYGRSLRYICNKLNENINIVNEYMTPLGYTHINLHFTLEKIQSKEYRHMMNELHHHFEVLMGPAWNVSEWYKKTPDDRSRTAIRMLNNLCHEIENIVSGIKQINYFKPFQMLGLDIHPSLYMTVGLNGVNSQGQYFLDKLKEEVSYSGFQDFQETTKWGDVSLYYAQIGKTHRDVYHDNDTHIHRENISSHKIVTGEFCVHLNPFGNRLSRSFKRWCKKHDFDYKDKTLGIGFPVVAEIINPESSKRALEQKLRKLNDVYRISLEDDSGHTINSRTFDYTWQEEESWNK